MPGEAHVYFTAFSSAGKKSAGHVLCKIVSRTTVKPPLFPGALLPSNFIGKNGVRANSQVRFFTSLTGVLTGRKNKRDIFYPARTVF